MNRLLRISLDILLTSIVPIASWFFLSIILNEYLINVFSLTYAMQFVVSSLKAVFGTGANISGYRDKNKYSSDAGIILGTLIGGCIFGIIIFNIDRYINFMNMQPNIYKTFAIYSIIQIYLQLILQLILSKLYYIEENIKANKISITFNLLSFFSLILSAIFTKNEKISAIISLTILIIYIIIILIRNVNKITLKINILNCIKYDSVEFFTRINFIIIYLFGFSNAFNFGENYILAISFSTLVTDMQWDIATAICTVAKIDITKRKFTFKEHKKNAYTLILILLLSIVIMTFALYNQYTPNIKIISIFIIMEAITLIMYPLYAIKGCYLQLEYSALKTTLHKQIANILRTLMSFIPSPFCTLVGQGISMIYQLLYTGCIYSRINKKIKSVVK